MYSPPYFKSMMCCTSPKAVFVLLVVLLSISPLFSQKEQVYFGSHTLHATQLCKEGKLVDAITQIEIAIRDSVDSSDFFTWYSRGFIYKEAYKKLQADNPASTYRDVALQSFLKSRKMAGNISEQTENHDLALRYLANTYYNDALQSTLQVDLTNTSTGLSHMDTYCSIMQTIDHAEECPAAYASYYRARGQRFHELWSADEGNQKLWDLAVKDYREALRLLQHDCSISYNITALYCNLLVSMRNSPGGLSPAAHGALLSEAETWLTTSQADCKTDAGYTALNTQAQTLLQELKSEISSTNQPSKK